MSSVSVLAILGALVLRPSRLNGVPFDDQLRTLGSHLVHLFTGREWHQLAERGQHPSLLQIEAEQLLLLELAVPARLEAERVGLVRSLGQVGRHRILRIRLLDRGSNPPLGP